MKDLTVILEDRLGILADTGEARGNAVINIEGLGGFPCEGKGASMPRWRTRPLPAVDSRRSALSIFPVGASLASALSPLLIPMVIG